MSANPAPAASPRLEMPASDHSAGLRIVIFADWDHWVPRALVRRLLAISKYPALRVVGVCVPRPEAYRRRLVAHGRDRLVGWAKRWCLGDRRYLRREPWPINLHALGRRRGFDVVVVPDANGDEAVEVVRDRLRAQVLLSFFWKRKFSASFLALFEQTVNYHNGRVPDYRGLRATPWSIYRGESHSGFTFHRIDGRLDRGNVLVEGAVPIEAQASVFEVEHAKTRLAEAHLPALLDAILANSPGIPQSDTNRYNKLCDIADLARVDEPLSVSSTELLRRVRAFGPVRARLGEEFVWVSGLGDAVRGPDRKKEPLLQLEDGAWRVKAADWRAHRLSRIRRRVVRG